MTLRNIVTNLFIKNCVKIIWNVLFCYCIIFDHCLCVIVIFQKVFVIAIVLSTFPLSLQKLNFLINLRGWTFQLEKVMIWFRFQKDFFFPFRLNIFFLKTISVLKFQLFCLQINFVPIKTFTFYIFDFVLQLFVLYIWHW